MKGGTKGLVAGLAAVVVAGVLFGAAVRHRPRASEADVTVITHGDEVNLTDHLVRGKYTLFDFYAVWCPPCRALSPALERLAARRPEMLALRKVDIVDWTMPVAAQHHVESLPYLVLFDGEGRRVAEGDGVFEALTRLFGEAAREVDQVSASGESARPGAPIAGPGKPSTL